MILEKNANQVSINNFSSTFLELYSLKITSGILLNVVRKVDVFEDSEEEFETPMVKINKSAKLTMLFII